MEKRSLIGKILFFSFWFLVVFVFGISFTSTPEPLENNSILLATCITMMFLAIGIPSHFYAMWKNQKGGISGIIGIITYSMLIIPSWTNKTMPPDSIEIFLSIVLGIWFVVLISDIVWLIDLAKLPSPERE